jgi:hypothetical protein
MAAKILQINFKLNISKEEYLQAANALVDGISAVDGLRWKVWIMNEAEKEAGGIYLFEDEATLNAYLQGEIVAQVAAHPGLSDISVKQFDVMDDVTATCRGPV